MGSGSTPGVKREGRDVDHPPPSRAEVTERVEIYSIRLHGFTKYSLQKEPVR
jgi:hypothetical protein